MMNPNNEKLIEIVRLEDCEDKCMQYNNIVNIKCKPPSEYLDELFCKCKSVYKKKNKLDRKKKIFL